MCNNILKFRKKAGMTQKKLADKINVSQQFISDIENGKVIPSLMQAYHLKEALGCNNVEDLFYMSD